MNTALNIGLSGLYADSLRINTSTNNLANQWTTGRPGKNDAYKPQDVVQTTNQNGGVNARTVNRSPSSVQQYQPYSPVANKRGVVNSPNVNTTHELGNFMKASSNFSMLTGTIKGDIKRTGQLVDILA